MVSFTPLCGNCSHQNCCTNSSEPLVFEKELDSLRQINKHKEQFIKKITIMGKSANVIRKKEDSSECVFWDSEKKNCTIYEARPFDCKAYPFDILKINGKYHWIVYSCNPESDWEWSEKYLDFLENDHQFLELVKNLDIFSNNTKRVLPKESQKTPYQILRQVRFTGNIKNKF